MKSTTLLAMCLCNGRVVVWVSLVDFFFACVCWLVDCRVLCPVSSRSRCSSM